ncbi:MAG: protein-glutamate O-methyltransferase CheR [Proteobacteria bacterium]|nr:protein-glutamate O-methyltransferase CheR [Pseudomonadota bacterium]
MTSVSLPIAPVSGRSSSDIPLSEKNFAEIASIMLRDCGIEFSKTKQALIHSRLIKRLHALRLQSFDEYCDLIRGDRGTEERARMRDALTTNVTRFFREPHHFEHLRKHVLAPAINRIKAGGRLRIWSAGCSSGQEPYSIALTILDMLPDARSYDVKILATDISENVLGTARNARYPIEELEGIPVGMRRSWIESEAEHFRLDDAVKGLVTLKSLNLIGNWPMKGPFDAIFCRNVVIYFGEATQVQIWQKMLPLLSPSGAVYIGHSERISGPAMSHFAVDGITTYLVRKAAAA